MEYYLVGLVQLGYCIKSEKFLEIGDVIRKVIWSRKMSVQAGANGLSSKELELWLSRTFIPIEPSDAFVRKLRARLIKYHGKQPFSGWMVLGAVAMALMLLLTWFGIGLRMVLLLLSLLGLKDHRKRGRMSNSIVATGAIDT